MDDSTRGSTSGITPSQALITGGEPGPSRRYRRLVLGEDQGWADLLRFEILTGLLGPLPGMAGIFLRQKLYPALLGRLEAGVAIGRNVTLRHPRRISLGANVSIDDNVLLEARDGALSIGAGSLIGRNSILAARGGELIIGAGCNLGSGVRVGSRSRLVLEDFVLVAAGCYIGAGNHRSDRLDVPVISQGMEESKPSVIGRGAWLGAGAVVLDGVSVGRDAIIGALSLVNQDIPPLAVAYGQPARVVRFRDGR